MLVCLQKLDHRLKINSPLLADFTLEIYIKRSSSNGSCSSNYQHTPSYIASYPRRSVVRAKSPCVSFSHVVCIGFVEAAQLASSCSASSSSSPPVSSSIVRTSLLTSSHLLMSRRCHSTPSRKERKEKKKEKEKGRKKINCSCYTLVACRSTIVCRIVTRYT